MPAARGTKKEPGQQTQALQVVSEPPVDSGETEIDLMELFFVLLENLKWIIVAAVLGAALMGVYSFFIATPQYESTAKLYVLNAKDSVVNLSDLQIGSSLTSDYLEVFKTWEVHERVIGNLSLPYTYNEIQKKIRLTNPASTRILYITATSSDPSEAALIANEYAAVAREYISETMSTDAPNVLSTALKPTIPVSPNKTQNVLIGGVLGGILAVAVIVIRMLLDDKIKTTDDIQRYAGMPTLAVVPLVDLTGTAKRPGAPAPAKKNGR